MERSSLQPPRDLVCDASARLLVVYLLLHPLSSTWAVILPLALPTVAGWSLWRISCSCLSLPYLLSAPGMTSRAYNLHPNWYSTEHLSAGGCRHLLSITHKRASIVSSLQTLACETNLEGTQSVRRTANCVAACCIWCDYNFSNSLRYAQLV